MKKTSLGNMLNKRIDVLDGLRGYAVICVFMVHFASFHYRHEYFADNNILYYFVIFFRSHLGVDLFFAISGFLMCLIYFTKEINFRQFYSLRLVRLAPAYVAAVLLYYVHKRFNGVWDWGLMTAVCLGAYLFSKTNLLLFFRYFPAVQILGGILLFVVCSLGSGYYQLYGLVANILFLQYFFHFPVLAYVSWSLVSELIFYILFFLVKRLSHQSHIKVSYFLVGSVFMAFLFQVVFTRYLDVRGLNLHRYMSFATGTLLGFVVANKAGDALIPPLRRSLCRGGGVLIGLILLEQSWRPLLDNFSHPISRWIYYMGAAIVFFYLIREAMQGGGGCICYLIIVFLKL